MSALHSYDCELCNPSLRLEPNKANRKRKRRSFDSLSNLHQHCTSKHKEEFEGVLTALARPLSTDVLRLLSQIIFEDDHLAVLNKPQGIDTVRYSHSDTVLLLRRPRGVSEALSGPQFVHRIDKSTGGLLVFAKTLPVLRKLTQMFAARKVTKQYVAVVAGSPKVRNGVILEPVSAKPSDTKYVCTETKTLPNGQQVTQVELWPRTGRRHQLRRHMRFLGHPIVGDTRYGMIKGGVAANAMMLFATSIELEHPVKAEKLIVKLPPFDVFAKIQVSTGDK